MLLDLNWVLITWHILHIWGHTCLYIEHREGTLRLSPEAITLSMLHWLKHGPVSLSWLKLSLWMWSRHFFSLSCCLCSCVVLFCFLSEQEKHAVVNHSYWDLHLCLFLPIAKEQDKEIKWFICSLIQQVNVLSIIKWKAVCLVLSRHRWKKQTKSLPSEAYILAGERDLKHKIWGKYEEKV